MTPQINSHRIMTDKITAPPNNSFGKRSMVPHVFSGRRSVTFSGESSCIQYSTAHSEETKKWLSQHEQSTQRQALVQDIRAARTLLATTPAQGNLGDNIAQFLGIEAFLSPGFARQALLDKRRHILLILSQQGRLHAQELSDRSAASSKLSSRRAHLSAVRYWEMSNGQCF